MKQSIIVALTIATSASAMEKSVHIPTKKPYNKFAAELLERQRVFRQFLILNAYGDHQSMQQKAAQLGLYHYPTPCRQSPQEQAACHYRLSCAPLFFALLVILVAGGAQVYSLL
jgi:hypothetical protein